MTLLLLLTVVQDPPFNVVGERVLFHGEPRWWDVSADLKHWYAVRQTEKGFIVTFDGVDGRPFERIQKPLIAGPKVAYVAEAAGEAFVVVGDEPHKRYALVKHLALSPNGRCAYRAVLDQDVLVVDGFEVARLESELIGLWWNGDGTRLAYATKTALVDGDRKLPLSAPLLQVSFSPDGKRLAVLTHEALYVDGAEVLRSNRIYSFVWSPDSIRWCATTGDGTFYIGNKDNPAKHPGVPGTFTFSPDGKRYAYVDRNETILVDERPLGTFDRPRRLQFSPDGTMIAFVEAGVRVRAGEFMTPAYSEVVWFGWSGDSAHLVSLVKDRDKFRVLLDAQPEAAYEQVRTPVISGRRVGYAAFDGRDVKLIVRELKKK